MKDIFGVYDLSSSSTDIWKAKLNNKSLPVVTLVFRYGNSNSVLKI